MPPVNIPNPVGPEKPVLARQAWWVEINEDWFSTAFGGEQVFGPWIPVPYIRPVVSRSDAAPLIGRATFEYEFGANTNSIQRENLASFDDYPHLNLSGKYCRIMVAEEGRQPFAMWYGIFESFTVPVQTTVYGTQTLIAYELTHLLDRAMVKFAVADAGTSSTGPDFKQIQSMPTFNRKKHEPPTSRPGENPNVKTFTGNKSTNTIEREQGTSGTEKEISVFGKSPNLWNAFEIVDYLIFNNYEGIIPVHLSGQYEGMKDYKDIWNVANMSVWQAINTIINRKRGYSFYPEIGDDGHMYLRVFSVSRDEIIYGEAKLPANDNKTYFRLPSDFYAKHYWMPIEIEVSEVEKYDRIVVVSKPIVITATFEFPKASRIIDHGVADRTYPATIGEANRFQLGPLVEGWDVGAERDYRQPPGFDADPFISDLKEFRSQDKYRDVYCTYVVGPAFNAFIDNFYYRTLINIAPTIDVDGTVDFFNEQANTSLPAGRIFYNAETIFERVTPLQVGIDYDDQDLKFDNDPNIGAPEFLPLTAFGWARDVDEDAQDFQAFPNFAEDWLRMDEASESSVPDPIIKKNCNVTPLTRRWGVRLGITPRHYYGRYHFIPEGDGKNAAGDDVDPVFNYQDIAITGSFKSAARQIIAVQLSNELGPNAKTLWIETDAEYWWVMPGTIYDISDKGEPLTVRAKNAVLRDDTKRLQEKAALVAAWFSITRQEITATKKRIEWMVNIGEMVMNITGSGSFIDVNTPVSTREVNYEDQTTAIVTGFADTKFIPEVN